jgi:two-component system chemotaxis response regulator CheB
MAQPGPAVARPRDAADGPIRVMLVDDSAFIRGMIGRWIADLPDIAVVASHSNGRRAADDVARSQPDVIVLDIEMPEMDGLTALPLILERRPGTTVIVASTLSRRGAEVSLRALTLGAADYIPKPDAATGLASAADFRTDLIAKIRSLGARRTRRLPARSSPAAAERPVRPAVDKSRLPVATRHVAAAPVRLVVIGSSTGGPQALTRLFGDAGQALARVPVLVVQHMPPTFTAILAEHIGKAAGRPAAEGVDGEALRPGRIYVAPGGRHMLIAGKAGEAVIRLTDDPPVNFCKPAVDPLFSSAAHSFGAGALAIVLTGMGSDGAKGAAAIAEAGGAVIAQDEATSVVWGMPGAAVAAGACSEVLSLSDIGPRVARILTGVR